VSVTELSLHLLRLTVTVCPTQLMTLILDDTMVPRRAKFGPEISTRHALCNDFRPVSQREGRASAIP
jgi:hypothetical protein